MDQARIRNFCIIAHIDHGKSTLADRLLQLSGAVDRREFRDQVLDDMDLERERGITIKASCVQLHHRAGDGQEYLLDLIDTPGHVDFAFEVAKSLQACEGTLLIVDATQGVEAQTVANYLLAKEHGLAIIPVINKIDLGHAQIDRVTREIRQLLQQPDIAISQVSAKEGRGVEEVLERVVREIPPPMGNPANPLAGLVFDSVYDDYKGVVVFVKVVEGTLRRGMGLTFLGSSKGHVVQEVGVLTQKPVPVEELCAGEVGYLTANIRDPRDVLAGETITETARPGATALPGFRRLKPMVFAGIYPANTQALGTLRSAMEKLLLNDAAFYFAPEQSDALGQGFRCGLLEPYVEAVMLAPATCLGILMDLVKQDRGTHRSTEFLSETRVKIVVELPLSEIVVDFYDRLKSLTQGYGSFDYELTGYRAASLVRLDILINGRLCEPLSSIVAKDHAYEQGRALVERLRHLIPRQLFEVAIQAAVGNHVIARESVL